MALAHVQACDTLMMGWIRDEQRTQLRIPVSLHTTLNNNATQAEVGTPDAALCSPLSRTRVQQQTAAVSPTLL